VDRWAGIRTSISERTLHLLVRISAADLENEGKPGMKRMIDDGRELGLTLADSNLAFNLRNHGTGV
jgi:hypothetical protein